MFVTQTDVLSETMISLSLERLEISFNRLKHWKEIIVKLMDSMNV